MADRNMNDLAGRTETMRRDAYIVGIVGFGAANGMHFSPYFEPAFLVMRPFIQVTFFTSSPVVLFYLTSLMVATLSIMVAGVPAAVYERLRGMRETTSVSYMIWLGGMILITAPTVMALARRGGG
jgi:hypothetical protein